MYLSCTRKSARRCTRAEDKKAMDSCLVSYNLAEKTVVKQIIFQMGLIVIAVSTQRN